MSTKKGWVAGWIMLTALSAGMAHAAPEDDYKEGVQAQIKDDLQTAMPLFKRAAEAGHTPSMTALGTLLDQAEENDAALGWLTKAANAGDAAGMLGLGALLLSGDVGKNRDKEGLAWIEKSAEKQHGPAVMVLAKILMAGKNGATVDPERALRLLQTSAEAGFIPAIKELARIYRTGDAGVKPDPALAKSWEAKVPEPPRAKKNVTR
ncbi:MAG: sel1 repeat family protein [Magnetococcales bacterium]|nr:sel1 repeat family protein [Magnetococcales bacterium]